MRVLGLIQSDRENSAGHSIAKIVTEWEPIWCRWKDDKAPGFEKPPSNHVKEKIITHLRKENPNFAETEFTKRRELKARGKDG